MVVAIIGHDDRIIINLCLKYNYIMSYEPRNFKGKLSEYPNTMEYGRKVDNLRKKYSDYLWDGEFTDIVGATVMEGKTNYDDYAVFINPKNGKKAVVLVNSGLTSAKTLTVSVNGLSGKLVSVTPEDLEEKEYNESITVPPLSTLVLIEK